MRVFLLALYLASLTACSSLGVTAPATFDQQAIVAQATITQLRISATQLLQVKAITVTDAQNVLAQTDAAETGITVARSMYLAACPPVSTVTACLVPATASAKLTAVTGILSAVRTYLESRP